MRDDPPHDSLLNASRASRPGTPAPLTEHPVTIQKALETPTGPLVSDAECDEVERRMNETFLRNVGHKLNPPQPPQQSVDAGGPPLADQQSPITQEELAALKAERDRAVERVKRKLADAGRRGVPHAEFVTLQPHERRRLLRQSSLSLMRFPTTAPLVSDADSRAIQEQMNETFKKNVGPKLKPHKE